MFEKLLQKLLKDVVGQFIDGIDTKKLNVGIWSGTVEIVNVSLKPRILALLGLPYSIIFSNISRLYITIPWKNLFTAPMVIEIDSIQILAENSVCSLSQEQQGKLALLKIKQFIQRLVRDLATTKKTQQKSNGGYFQTVYLKMLDNLYLTIKNIHFRFEVSRALKLVDSPPFSFGLTLQSIQLFAVDQKGNKIFVDRAKLGSDKNVISKKLKLENFGFYWNFEQKDTILLSLQNKVFQNQKQKQSHQKYIKQMLDLKQIMAGKGLAKEKINYIIMINAEGIVKEDNRFSDKGTRYEISFAVKQLKMILNQKIIKQIVWFLKETASIDQKQQTITKQQLGKWQGPKNQVFLRLLRKYCISELMENQNSGKTNTLLAANEQKILIGQLFENKDSFIEILDKVREIVIGEMGSKNAISKSDIMKNWQNIEVIMEEQKKIQGNQNSLKFNFEMSELSVFYVDEVKIPIAQLFIKGFRILAEQTENKQLNLKIEIAKLEGFGYDQNAIIKMQHEIQSPFSSSKVMNFEKFLCIQYCVKSNGFVEMNISVGGVGFIYDFKTFRQLYKLPESLIQSQSSSSVTSQSPPSPSKAITTQITTKNAQQQKSQFDKQKSSTNSQITIMIENVSFYVQQYTKTTWRLSLSGCQMTNSQSLMPQNILINAISISVSDLYVVQPFCVKIVANLRNSTQQFSVVLEPIKIKMSGQIAKLLLKINGCFGTYRKTDAVSLSSKYGQVYLLDESDVWKKYDGIIIEGLLYLFQKNQEYSKKRLRVIQATKKKDKENKRELIQIVVMEEKQNKYYLLVRNQSQFQQWLKYLTQLSASNQKILSKQLQVKSIPQSKTQSKPTDKEYPTLHLISESITFEFSQNQEQPTLKFVVLKTIIETVSNSPSQKEGKALSISKESSQNSFKSFGQLAFTQENSKISSKSEHIINVEIKNVQFWYKKQKRLNFESNSNQNSVYIKIVLNQSNLKIETTIKQKMILDYEPFQIIKIQSLIHKQKLNISNSSSTTSSPSLAPTQAGHKESNNQLQNINISFEKGVRINGYNILSYGYKQRSKVLRANVQKMIVSLNSEGTKLSIKGLSLLWFEEEEKTNGYEIICEKQKDCENIQNNLNNIVVEISSKTIVNVSGLYLPNYKHYRVMRVIQYIDVQLKQCILNPQTFNQYFENDQPQTHTRMFRLKNHIQNTMTSSEVEKRIKTLSELHVTLKNSVVELERLGSLIFGEISVKNNFVNKYNESIKQNIMLDQYQIGFKDVNILLNMPVGKNHQQKSEQKKDEADMPILTLQKGSSREQKFYTVLNRFSTSEKQEWKDRDKKNRIAIVGSNHPLDMTLSILMFGKYPQYKTLFSEFEYSELDSMMKIQLQIKELFTCLFPKEIDVMRRFVILLMANLNDDDGFSYKYSYDKKINAQLLHQTIQVKKDQKNTNKLQVLGKDQYMFCPLSFDLQIKNFCFKALIPPIQPNENKNNKINEIQQVQIFIDGLFVKFQQWPKIITAIKWDYASISLIKNKNIQTLIQNSIIDDEDYEKQLVKSQQQTGENIEIPSKSSFQYRNYQIQENLEDESIHKPEKTFLKTTSIQVENIFYNFSFQTVKSLIRLKELFEHVKAQNQLFFAQGQNELFIQDIVKQRQSVNSHSLHEPLSMKIERISVKIPINSSTFLQGDDTQNENQSHICVLASILVKTQLPSLSFLVIQIIDLSSFIEQIKDPIEVQPIKKYSMSFTTNLPARERNRSFLNKNKRKVILQPTNIKFNKYLQTKIKENVISSGKKEPSSKNSRLKSLLNFSENEEKEQKLNELQKINIEIHQIQIGKCFFKFSIEDLKTLSKLAASLSSGLNEMLFSSQKTNTENSVKSSSSQRTNPQNSIQSPQKLKQSTKQIKTMDSSVLMKINPLEIIIINENSLGSNPLLYSKVQINYSKNGEFHFKLIINYFNLRINVWEPFLQSCSLIMKLQPHLSILQFVPESQTNLNLGDIEKQKINQNRNKENEKGKPLKTEYFININISTNFLEALLPDIMNTSGQKMNQRFSQAKLIGDQVNCWMINNQLGYDIEVSRQSLGKTIFVGNNKQVKLSFLNEFVKVNGFQLSMDSDLNMGKGVKDTNENSGKVKISLTINREFKIKDIQIGQMGTKKFCFNYEGKSFWLYRHTSMDISKNVRYIKFYSGLLVYNQTNLNLWLSSPDLIKQKELTSAEKNSSQDEQNRRQKSWVSNKVSDKAQEKLKDNVQFKINPVMFSLPSKKKVSLPFNLDESFKKLSEADFAKLIEKQNPLQIKQASQILRSFQFVVHKQKKRMQTIYKILPNGKIINKLPETLNIAFKKQEKILYSFSMEQDSYDYLYTPFSQLQISINSQGYQWSDFVCLNSIDTINLIDLNLNKLPIKVCIYNDQNGVVTATLYPLAVLYNDSSFQISIKYSQSKSKTSTRVQPQKAISLSSNKFLVFKPQLPQSSNFSTKNTKYTKILLNQQQITCNFQMSSQMSQLINDPNKTHSVQSAFQSMIVNQISLQSGNSHNSLISNQTIMTRFITVSHKFYFKNSTKHKILVRKYAGPQNQKARQAWMSVRSYEAFSKQTFCLFEGDALNPKIPIYYQITIQNSPYEWSGGLSITNIGNTHFLLRNRSNFNDVLFMKLNIIKYHKMQKFSIELQQIQQSQAPFKIVNSWKNSIIKLPQYGNITLKQGQESCFSWDQPLLKPKTIIIMVKNPEDSNENNLNKFYIKTQNPQQNELLKFKRFRGIGEINVIEKENCKVFEIREYEKAEKKAQELKCQIQLPIRIALINNSFNPAYHLCDISTTLGLSISQAGNGTVSKLNLESIQVDNQTRHRVYFPVVLSTSLSLILTTDKEISLEVLANPILLNIEEDFGKDFYSTVMLISALTAQQSSTTISQIQNEPSSSPTLISKLILPKLSIKLQVKTNKLSIQTTVNLERPSVTKYPWSSFPYPIKNIVINLLSHLSISPWSVISSFQKGVMMLLTEQQSTRGIQSFFGQILAALSNSLNGLIGILVGHDIERVDNFFDGIEQGANLLALQIMEIKDCFEPEQCTPWEIMKSLGIGVTSIILKPLKGVLQMTLKISQGIKKTALFSFEELGSKYRQRQMIVFYGEEQRFMAYDTIQSQFYVMLLKVCGEPLKYFHLLKFYPIHNNLTGSTYILTIGAEQIILIDAKKEKLIWQIGFYEIERIDLIRDTAIRFMPSFFEVETFNQSTAEQIYNFLSKVQKNVYIKG